jgi:hypothetical protein
MTDPTPEKPAERSLLMRILRRTAATLLLGIVVFAVLWYAVFDAVTAALVASGGAVVFVGGASVSETVSSIFETLAEILLGIVGAIAEFFSSLFD